MDNHGDCQMKLAPEAHDATLAMCALASIAIADPLDAYLLLVVGCAGVTHDDAMRAWRKSRKGIQKTAWYGRASRLASIYPAIGRIISRRTAPANIARIIAHHESRLRALQGMAASGSAVLHGDN